MRKVPQPSSKAVLVFAMDLSGSMSGEPVERAKKFFYNSIEVLKRSFADIEFKLIGFDSKSHLFQSEKKFFRTELGGSTSYAAGIKMAADVLENYPEDEYNRYFYLAGDSGDFDAAGAETELERVLKLTEHVGYVETGTYADARFQAMLDSVAQRVPEKFTYSIYNGKKGSLIKSLEDFFTEGQARQGDDY
jgi:uncharacterized sporulation protein YeaH/YhbH (DUF444 family)